MNDCKANCPLCNSAIEFSIDLLDTIILCPCCKEEICFSEKDIIEFSEAVKKRIEAKKIEEEVKQKQAQQRIAERKKQERFKQEYRFIILKFEEIENTLNHLLHNEGWQVVSQSTVFLSETSAGFGSLERGTKTEGIAYTLKKEKIV